MGLGARLKEILKEQNMTIKELSKLSGVSLNTLYSITKRDNNMARFDIVEKIALALNISPEELVQHKIDYEKANNEKNAHLYEVMQKNTLIDNPTIVLYPSLCKALSDHHIGDDFTPEEIEEIQKFVDYLKSKREKH